MCGSEKKVGLGVREHGEGKEGHRGRGQGGRDLSAGSDFEDRFIRYLLSDTTPAKG